MLDCPRAATVRHARRPIVKPGKQQTSGSKAARTKRSETGTEPRNEEQTPDQAHAEDALPPLPVKSSPWIIGCGTGFFLLVGVGILALWIHVSGRPEVDPVCARDQRLVQNYLKFENLDAARAALRDAQASCLPAHADLIAPLAQKLEAKTKAAEAAKVARLGQWATFPKPGVNVADTEENRLAYIGKVLAQASGEPPLNEAQARLLLEKWRAALADMTNIPVSKIKIHVGDSSGGLHVDHGAMAIVKADDGRKKQFPACSEAFIATSFVNADLKDEDFAKAGLRGVTCTSEGCSVVLNMRPNAPKGHGALYSIEKCASMEDVMLFGITH